MKGIGPCCLPEVQNRGMAP